MPSLADLDKAFTALIASPQAVTDPQSMLNWGYKCVQRQLAQEHTSALDAIQAAMDTYRSAAAKVEELQQEILNAISGQHEYGQLTAELSTAQRRLQGAGVALADAGRHLVEAADVWTAARERAAAAQAKVLEAMAEGGSGSKLRDELESAQRELRQATSALAIAGDTLARRAKAALGKG